MVAEGREQWWAAEVEIAQEHSARVPAASGLPPLSVYFASGVRGRRIAGFGTAAERRARGAAEVEAVLSDLFEQRAPLCETVDRWPVGPWFGGLAFDLHHTPRGAWEAFPTSRWIIPEVLHVSDRAGSRLFGLGRSPGEASERVRRAAAALQATGPSQRDRESGPRPRGGLVVEGDPTAWRALVERALGALSEGRFEKVVVARKLTVTAGHALSVPGALERLGRRYPSCETFAIAGEGGAVFLGATPERLCRVRARSLVSVALAGTGPPDVGMGLLGAEKELREHRVVIDGIRQALSPWVERLWVASSPSLVRLPNVVHLRSPVRARLLPGASFGRVVTTLHPTPAVGGLPRNEALRFIAEYEGLERGWYAGAVGWIGSGRADLHVALRSALVAGCRADVFVGAGVVRGSSVEAEWRETEAKAAPVLEALEGASWQART